MIGWVLSGTLTTLDPAVVFHGPLLAYVDPGAGSFLLQAILAAMAGIIVTVNLYWNKIKTLLGIGTKPDDSDPPPTGPESHDE
jgi:hypothetical protein